MSRGPGDIQRAVTSALRLAGKPVTIAEMIEVALPGRRGRDVPATRLRSIQRALKRFVDSGDVVVLSDGRYALHPRLLGDGALNGNLEAARALAISTVNRIRGADVKGDADVTKLAASLLHYALQVLVGGR
jgi:hypothetical protein